MSPLGPPPNKWSQFESDSNTKAQQASALNTCASQGYTGPSVTVPCTDGTFTFVAGYAPNPTPPVGYTSFPTAGKSSTNILAQLNSASAIGYTTTADYAECTDGNYVFVGGF